MELSRNSDIVRFHNKYYGNLPTTSCRLFANVIVLAATMIFVGVALGVVLIGSLFALHVLFVIGDISVLEQTSKLMMAGAATGFVSSCYGLTLLSIAAVKRFSFASLKATFRTCIHFLANIKQWACRPIEYVD